MLKNKTILIAAMLFGSVVGAGFASGKEIFFYFGRFGNFAFIFAFLAVALFGVFCYVFLMLGKKFALNTLQQTSNVLFGKLASLAELVLVCGNLVLLSSMLAGSNSLFNLALPTLPIHVASILTGLCSLFIVFKGFKWLVRINELLAPAILFVIFLLLILTVSAGFKFMPPPPQTSLLGALSPIVSSILFVCGNIFFVGFVIAKYGQNCTKKQALCGSVLAGTLLLICIIIELIILFLAPQSTTSDMPLMYVATLAGTFPKVITLIVIATSILATASIMHYTITDYLQTFIKNKLLAALIVLIAAFILSLLGFSNIITYVYPILGALGVILCLSATIRLKVDTQTNPMLVPQSLSKNKKTPM